MPIDSDTTPEWWSLFDYSEWLDGEGAITDEHDGRTHEELVDDFMAQRAAEQ